MWYPTRLKVLLIGVTFTAAVLAACGGATSQAAPAATAIQATVTPTRTATPVATPTVIPTATTAATPTATAASAPGGNGDLLAKGKVVFEKTAGGVGCAYCHGLDGKGSGPSGLNAPTLRGKTEVHVRDALQNIMMMSFVKLNEDEIVAVAAYLEYLNQQP